MSHLTGYNNTAYLRLDATNSPVTGPVEFTNTMQLTIIGYENEVVMYDNDVVTMKEA